MNHCSTGFLSEEHCMRKPCQPSHIKGGEEEFAAAENRAKHQKYAGYVTMDCCYADTAASRQLISNSPTAITTNPPPCLVCTPTHPSLKHHTVPCIMSPPVITKEHNFPPFTNLSVLIEFLTMLSDKGLNLSKQRPR